MNVTRAEWAVFFFTIAYAGIFGAWFLSIGNLEFLWYLATMAAMIALVGFNLRKAEFSPALLWALSIWGLAHMAGGGVPVGGSVLYSAVLFPVGGSGELTILKYDQLVHAYGFGTTAWLLWHLMRHNYPGVKWGWTLYVYPALGSMGLGATNEIIEFLAVLGIKDTNVGGYYNTALDLVFNAAGACLAMLVLALASRR
ncbi:DUF2238 domain-containing protein [Defluviimonas sp. WL0002]|uniref:DUF2238 domain-containing protein n=1 Tax=Albidovulum marisflavi TaxID=2984159 RepID=A0ABT2ZCH5_9RHOB|nr:DUF2238 domain-containing protein [Defluviimonas sp. WL0002]MCV2868772.1 DUF2238 domain-containing protein [Defluviimonas sp. WL0002]